MTHPQLTRQQASDAVTGLGWRYVLGDLRTTVAVDSATDGLAVVAAAVEACGVDADDRLRVDLRSGVVELCLQSMAATGVDSQDAALARAVTDAVAALGHHAEPLTGTRPVQVLEIAVDALDIAAIRPFWRAVLGYQDEPGTTTPDAVVDPHRVGPSVWFQQMDEPRQQRNRIHFDLTVPHDAAAARVEAAIAAGGVLVSDDQARAFWILADDEGNEVCVCTWQDREPGQPATDG